MVDLAQPSFDSKDRFDTWEKQLPFARTSMAAFRRQLNLAHEKSGGQGIVTREAFLERFTSAVWLKNLEKWNALFQGHCMAEQENTDEN